MMKLKKFLQDPLGAYQEYITELNQDKLKSEVDVLKQQCINHQRTISEEKTKNKKLTRGIRTMYWYYTGEKMKRGTEIEFVQGIREETKEG